MKAVTTALGALISTTLILVAAPAWADVTYVYGDATGGYFAYTAPSYIQPIAKIDPQHCDVGACSDDVLRKNGVDILYLGGNTNAPADFAEGAFGQDGVYFGLNRLASLVVFSHPGGDPVSTGDVTYVYGDDSGAFFLLSTPSYIQPIQNEEARYCSADACSNDFIRKSGADVLYPGRDTNDGAAFVRGAFGESGVYFGTNRTASLVVFPATAAVPEPVVWALLFLGFGMTGAALRRRRTTPSVQTS